MRGEYIFWPLHRPTLDWAAIAGRRKQLVIPNRVVDEGEEEFLKMIFQDVTTIAGGANWYVGLCNQTPAETDTLASISTEPSGAGGYARQALVRSNVGWPTIGVAGGHKYIESATVTFSASGADFSVAFTRFFLCSPASGTSGKLYSFSGALTAALLIADGQSYAAKYRLYMD